MTIRDEHLQKGVRENSKKEERKSFFFSSLPFLNSLETQKDRQKDLLSFMLKHE